MKKGESVPQFVWYLKLIFIEPNHHLSTIPVTGGGITQRNLERILKESGAREFHASARTTEQSTMSYRNTNVFMGAALRPPEFTIKVADSGLIQALNEIYQNFEDAQPWSVKCCGGRRALEFEVGYHPCKKKIA